MGYIYIHTNKVNGKKYIGQTTVEPSRRWCNGRGYINNTYFYNAIQKYGWDSFEHYCFPCPNELLDEVERFYIKYHDTTNPSKGYNRDLGGHRPSKEMCEKMSEARKGKHHSEETKRKIGEKSKGRTKSEETLNKMRKTYYMYKKDGTFVEEFSGLKSIEQYLRDRGFKAHYQNIYAVLDKKGRTAYGYVWKTNHYNPQKVCN